MTEKDLSKEIKDLEKEKKRLVEILESKKIENKEAKVKANLEDEIRAIKNSIRIRENEISGKSGKSFDMKINRLARNFAKNPVRYIMFAGAFMMLIQGEWFAMVGALVLAFVLPFMLENEKARKKESMESKQG